MTVGAHHNQIGAGSLYMLGYHIGGVAVRPYIVGIGLSAVAVQQGECTADPLLRDQRIGIDVFPTVAVANWSVTSASEMSMPAVSSCSFECPSKIGRLKRPNSKR